MFPSDPESVRQLVTARLIVAEQKRTGQVPIPISSFDLRRSLGEIRSRLSQRLRFHSHHTLAAYGSLDLFADLDRRTLRRLSDSFFMIDVDSGDSLGRQGDVVPEFVVVLEGRVGVSLDGLPLAVLDPGSHFGALPLLDDGPTPYSRASFSVLGPARIAVANRSQFRDILTGFPMVGRRIETIADVRRAYLAGRADAASNADVLERLEFPLHLADIG